LLSTTLARNSRTEAAIRNAPTVENVFQNVHPAVAGYR